MEDSILDRLLLDSNGDGFIDGVAACFVPLTPDACTGPLWAAMANLAARLGLETPAIHLPLVCTPAEVQGWQCPIFIAVTGEATALPDAAWAAPSDQTALVEEEGLRVTWLVRDEQWGLWLHGTDQAIVAAWLNQLAAATAEATAAQVAAPRAPAQDLDLAKLYSGEAQSFFCATQDGFTADESRVRLILGPETDAAMGSVAVNLAARLGLETAGMTLPLVSAMDEAPDASPHEHLLLLGFPHQRPTCLASEAGARCHQLGLATVRYLAESYPFLERSSQQAGDEQQTLKAIIDHLHVVLHAHPPVAKLALAEVQAGRSLHLLAAGSATYPGSTDQLRHVVFRQEWNPLDGLDEHQRLFQTFQEMAIPYLEASADVAEWAQITLFYNAPLPARERLAAACCAAMGNVTSPIQVLPAHKAGLAWLLETQLPRLMQREVARVKLHFQEFRPTAAEERWLDLPTRWLQELFPADELLAQRLGLPIEAVDLCMEPCDHTQPNQPPIYRLEAFAADGSLLHSDTLHLLWDERLYMRGLPQFGCVHPSTGGVILQMTDGSVHAWPSPTDSDLFWDFYQEGVLPALRQHVLASSGGRPTPAREPYFDLLAIDVAMGAPDEPLGIYEEFVSVGEALHEDLYFNTLDYLAALGEAFGGSAIEAAGQVVPWVHDYYGADGESLPLTGPRATVTLYDWAIPVHLPDLGLTVGDRRDMPAPLAVQVTALTVDDDGTEVRQVAVAVHYADAKQAYFAARVLTHWRGLVGVQSGFPPGIAISVSCYADRKAVATLDLLAAPAEITQEITGVETPTEPYASKIIGPQELQSELTKLAKLPGIQIWQVGRSYQGRPGYVIDVTLPVEPHQTHSARRKLALQKPTLLFVARHHANEVSSTTTALQMARDAVTDPEQRQWLKQVNLVFLPMENPDGAAIHYALMAEHPTWKHHAARFNAAGQEFSRDFFNPATPFGESRFRPEVWSRWLPDAIVDNHGVPSHEWCQPFAGYTTPPRFRVCYQVVQAMLYGIIAFTEDPEQPQFEQAAAALRSAVAQAVAATPWLHARNQYWLERYQRFGHRWLPEVSPLAVHEEMLFFYRGVTPARLPDARRNFAMCYPQITLLDWVTEVPDETAQGAYLAECAAAHQVANQAMIELLAKSAAPVVRSVEERAEGRVHIGLHRVRAVDDHAL